MANISVYTFITKGYKEYAAYCLKSLRRFESGKNFVTYYGIPSREDWGEWPRDWLFGPRSDDGNCNSDHHVKAVNQAISHIKRKSLLVDCCILIDADMCMLYPGWDEVVIKELENVDCWGGGYNIKTQKINGFPSLHFFCFKRELLDKIDLDFSMLPDVDKPKSCTRYRVIPGEEKIYGRPVGANVKCDTGWHLPMQFHKADLKWSAMEMLYSKFHNTLLPFHSEEEKEFCEMENRFYQQSEWHYDNKLFATHKKTYWNKKGHDFNGVFGKMWRDRIDMYLRGRNG